MPPGLVDLASGLPDPDFLPVLRPPAEVRPVYGSHRAAPRLTALEELTRGILLRHYPSIPPDAVRLVLVGSAILPQTASNLAAYAKEQLLSRGIELETTRAAAVSAEVAKPFWYAVMSACSALTD